MSFFESMVLGVVQGFSEFLPISSSAHLILTSRYLGWADQGLGFDMAANTGSLVAVLVFARRELAQILHGVGRALTGIRKSTRYRLGEARFALILFVSTLPVAIAGWIGRDFIASVARDPLVIASTSVLFAAFLFLADRRPEGKVYLSDIGIRMAVLIGMAQAVALIPGTSRSGVTLTAALLLGFTREAAVRFSFLLAVPVGLLVAVHQLTETAGAGLASGEAEAMAVGFCAAAVSAYAAITWLLSWIRRQNLQIFVVYRILLGAAILVSFIW